MPTSGGVAQISLALDSTDPQNDGVINPGISPLGSRSDHVHRMIYGFGYFVGSDGYPQLESTSTLSYFYIPSGKWLYWDTVEQYFYIGEK